MKKFIIEINVNGVVDEIISDVDDKMFSETLIKETSEGLGSGWFLFPRRNKSPIRVKIRDISTVSLKEVVEFGEGEKVRQMLTEDEENNNPY